MILKTKLAFEIWAGIVGLIIVVAFAAAGTLMLGNNDVTPLLRTQVNNSSSPASPTPSSFLSETDILQASKDIESLLINPSEGSQP